MTVAHPDPIIVEGLTTALVPPVQYVTDKLVDSPAVPCATYTGKVAAPPAAIVCAGCTMVRVGGDDGGPLYVAVSVAGDEPTVTWCDCASPSDQ